ncbi:MAG TPA: cysteine-rich CWC family protein [Polyangiaceae bacterium]|nr:cysteine-rich CWC family protein [Polyangiaceae bacterium]
MTDVDPNVCPSCGRPNDCQAALGKDTCWCFSVTIDPERLAAIPKEAVGKACLCPACATQDPVPGDGVVRLRR